MSGAFVMSPSLREVFPTGKTLSAKLTAVAVGMQAEAMLAELPEVPAAGATLIALPAFAAAHPEADAEKGDRLALIQWAGGVVHLATGDAELAWRIQDSRLPDVRGAARLSSGQLDLASLELTDGTQARARFVAGPTALRSALARWSSDGRAATIELLKACLPYTYRNVEQAGVRIHREITESPSTTTSVIDQIEVETICDLLLYGDDDTKDSLVLRLIRRCASSDVLAKKLPATYISAAIYSGAETEVRRHIGDPHQGRVIRRIARQIRSRDVQTVLAAVRAARPNLQIGVGQVDAALSAGASVAAYQRYLSEFTESGVIG